MLLIEWLDYLHKELAPVSDTPGLDGQVLLAEALEKPRAWILAHPEAGLTADQENTLAAFLERLKSGIPLPYVLGHWEFYGLDFTVTPEVLIPRPETELLVEQALAWLENHPGRRLAADVGTGSGCIAVSLAVHVPDLGVVASDLSPAALEVAQSNARRHQVEARVHCIESDLLPPLARPLDLICANLPYIPEDTLRSLPVFRAEPTLALHGGPDGLAVLRRLLSQAPQHLSSHGLMLLEIEASQGPAAYQLARAAFPDADVRLFQDLAGRDRLVRIGQPGYENSPDR